MAAAEQEADHSNPPVGFVKTPLINVCHTSGLKITQINDKATTLWPRYDETCLLTEIKKTLLNIVCALMVYRQYFLL